MKHLIYSVLILIGVSFSSCNYLNMQSYFEDFLPADSITRSEYYMKGFLYGTAGMLPNEGNLLLNSYGPYGVATDETILPWPDRADYAGIAYSLDHVTPESGYFNVYSTYYKGIRNSNRILSSYHQIPNLSSKGQSEIVGLTHFMRAMFYYRLLELYGPVPIVPDEVLDVDKDSEELSYERNTYDEVVEYICKDLDEAYNSLPEENASNLIFRPTKYAALAFKNRILLTAASPWYNGNTAYASWKTSDGRNFISQEYDPLKWARSAASAKIIIESGHYDLYTFPKDQYTPELPQAVSHENWPNGAGDIDPLRSYAHMFNGEALDARNPELIYAATFNQADLQLILPLKARGWNSWAVTQQLVDAYRMNDGTDYQKSDDFFEPIGAAKTFSEYELLGEAPKMFDNREPRFYATIGFNEWKLVGKSFADTSKDYYAASVNRRVNYFADGNSAPENANPNDRILSGYVCIKYLHPEDNFYAVVKRKTFPAMRYAETLLNYVEALNEIKGQEPYTETKVDGITVTVSYDPVQIQKYFNMIRYRGGIPGIDIATASNQEKMRDLIKRERMVEFAQEGRRFHDVRRWGIAEQTENAVLRGLDVSKRTNQKAEFYTPTEIQNKNALRVFKRKMYFYPIPRTAMDKNKKLVQNPGWGIEGEW